jgi:hypothetical protein
LTVQNVGFNLEAKRFDNENQRLLKIVAEVEDLKKDNYDLRIGYAND